MRHTRFLALSAAALLVSAALVCGVWQLTRPEPPLSPELETPKLVLSALDASAKAKPLFFTGAAVPFLKEHWTEWGSAFGSPAPSPEELLAAFEPAQQSPQGWRVLDRKWRFGAILLAGDPASFRNLLNYLRQASDWALTRLDATSYLFERAPAKAWAPADLPALLEAFQTHPAAEQKMARAQIAHRLMFIGENAEARTLLEELLKTDPKSKEGWTELAFLHGMSGEWDESYKAARQALAINHHFRPAQIAQAGALHAMNRNGEAILVTRKLYEAAPADTQVLLLHAKVTHAAHAFLEEIEVLQRLIGLMQGRSMPVGFWQIYLGQAYAATGNAILAEDQFKSALKDENLSPSDRAFVNKALEQLETKSDTLNLAPPVPEKSSLLDAPPVRP